MKNKLFLGLTSTILLGLGLVGATTNTTNVEATSINVNSNNKLSLNAKPQISAIITPIRIKIIATVIKLFKSFHACFIIITSFLLAQLSLLLYVQNFL